MKIIENPRKPGKFIVIAEMDYAELQKLLPIAAAIALLEVGNNFAEQAVYHIIEGELYAFLGQTGQWFYFDNSVRRWFKDVQPNPE
jgi:hypothetical protein